ncbi:peptidylprolyl isomerase [Sphingobacterium wenxiniae]|uniref:Peptidyl-prolyl cis-trans isomerase n=1 Tax=Sphingobacterium wenxiniae TaxID=683125 RepID=A0A1I6UPB7_9SPHI|nr:peptidylprolyl isomerase [Sphingobacterium wenxiniae]SFT03194.1 peptidyl-prolyl cis-trans isomerase B (cyclophilin B) [Sphingobacterium wenxiniae]
MKNLIKKCLALVLFLALAGSVMAETPLYHYVLIKTDKGDCLLRLYNETPKHRDNFVKLTKEGYFDSLLFHRVIHNFMVQGGDPDSRYAAEKQALGNGGPDYKINAEIQDGLFHRKGTIGAARDNNPGKQSSASQFYLVQGRVFTDTALDSLEQFRMQGKKFSPEQREAYKTVGGTPHLDGNYTVFGELLNGIETIDKIAEVKTDERDRPLQDVRMSMTVLTRREALNLEREAQGLKPKTGFFTRFFDLFSSKDY